jgi:ABC-type antimicrobial peptide transport system permease subunit
MKAVGIQREHILGMLLLENGIQGVIGGAIGVGLGLLLLFVLAGALQQDTAISLAAALLTARGASGEKPLNVLRYE